jgi:Peptidase family S41
MPMRCSDIPRAAGLSTLLASLPLAGWAAPPGGAPAPAAAPAPVAAPAPAAAPAPTAFDPGPWLLDLEEIRSAIATKYANLEWQVVDRGVDLEQLFARARQRLEQARSDTEARNVIDRLTRAFGDGHVGVRWPQEAGGTAPAARGAGLCARLGYNSDMGSVALGPALPGYAPLTGTSASAFPAGLVTSGGRKVAVLRIGLFEPRSSPETCSAALAALAIAPTAECDAACADRIDDEAYRILTRDLESRLRELQHLGAAALLIDLTGNGGGSQWAEAAARIVSPIELKSERAAFVRGAHWRQHWLSLATELHAAAAQAGAQDRAQLEHWAQAAERALREAETPCSSEPLWAGKPMSCAWLADGYYATGLIAAGDAAALHDKPWGARIFSPSQYEFTPRVWRGPLLVAIDGGTGSAAGEFAAVLQDNKAAVIIGAPGAPGGCGHTDGGTPTPLTHSGGVLLLPDCARLRADGSNEAAGVDPDVLVAIRVNDGVRHKALRLAAALPGALAAAERPPR